MFHAVGNGATGKGDLKMQERVRGWGGRKGGSRQRGDMGSFLGSVGKAGWAGTEAGGGGVGIHDSSFSDGVYLHVDMGSKAIG